MPGVVRTNCLLAPPLILPHSNRWVAWTALRAPRKGGQIPGTKNDRHERLDHQ